MVNTVSKAKCFHCGLDCPDHLHQLEDKLFCCEGCKTVYQILEENNLCQYYDFEKMAGNSPKIGHFQMLDDPEISKSLLDFENEMVAGVTFFLPKIHCSSCLYLLENLYRINHGIERSKVDFLKKQISITFKKENVNLKAVAELLATLGYEPLISTKNDEGRRQNELERALLTRLGVAGFCAGNIMMFSFPEYLGLSTNAYKTLFGYLNIGLSLPVVFYSGSGYFQSVYKCLKAGTLNIDFPILLSIVMAFLAGIYEVVQRNGAGYFDSLTGLIFFLLIGKWFQQKTFHFLSFDRDYKSYLPLAATRKNGDTESVVPIHEIKKGDKILVRNGELIPADAMLYHGIGNIDYSFVTGESNLESKKPGDLLYAGGRQVGGALHLEVLKEVSSSYLTQLWNNDTFRKNSNVFTKTFSNLVGKYFSIAVLSIASLVGLYWFHTDLQKMIPAVVAVLIIACPCTLSLSYPFALGHGIRLFAQRRFYLKNSDVIEQMANCDTLIFDKTGTLTKPGYSKIAFYGKNDLSNFEQKVVASLVEHSTHPISLQIKSLSRQDNLFEIEGFSELAGQGIEGYCQGLIIKIGSRSFIGLNAQDQAQVSTNNTSKAYLSINDTYIGYFGMSNQYRDEILNTLSTLSKTHELFLLSGDRDAERDNLAPYFKNQYFDMSPQDKLDFVINLQTLGKKVIMLGDGLNDAGALKQANVGIACTEDTLGFTPMSDAIIQADELKSIPRFLAFSNYGMKLIRFSYTFSLVYNLIGLTYAVQGNLSPIVAAILMPLNSITLVGISSLGMILGAKKIL